MPPLPPQARPEEEERLLALRRYGLLNEEPDPEYDAIVQLTAAVCEVPIALLALVDSERLRFKSRVGLPRIRQVGRAGSFCARVIEQDSLFLVEDTQADPRFQDNSRVRGDPHIRFFAGTPLRTQEGLRIGVLCLIDHVPRRLSPLQLRTLEQQGRQIETHFHLRFQLLEAQEQNAELERARSRLRVQGELLTSVLAHIPHSVFWKNREGVFLGCNDAFAHSLGRRTPQEVLGRTDHDFNFTSEQIRAFRRDDLEVLTSGLPKLAIEEPFRDSAGMERWLLTSKVPLRDPDGQVGAVLGIFADITERRAQEGELQQALLTVKRYAARLESMVHEARARTQRLMEASLDAVFVLDTEGRVLEANPVARHLFGAEGAPLPGRPFEALAPETDRAALKKAIAELRARGTMRLEEQELNTATGRRLVAQLLGSIQDEGEAPRLLLIAHDLSEQRRLEQQSIQNDRMAAMGVLAAGIAHEINNPTAYVLSNLDFLRQWWGKLEQNLLPLPPLPAPLQKGVAEARQILADCIDGCTRIQDIVRGMRHLSHQGPPDDQTLVDIHTTLDSVLSISQGELKHTARLEKSFAAGLPLVLGSEGRLGQVFLNLIVNAVQAMRPGTPQDNTLSIHTWVEAKLVRIDIKDTGHGIPREALPHIFDPFFTTKPAGAGTGLGLSISYAIIQKMGGELRVDSQVGQGTTFSVLLPSHEPDAL